MLYSGFGAIGALMRNWQKPVLGICLALALAMPGAFAADIEGQKITLTVPERKVDLTRFRAPGDARRPAVLLLHGASGFDGQIANYDRYCSELANNGIDAYLVYYYSAADSRGMRTGGDIFGDRYPAWAKLVDDLADTIQKSKDTNGKVGLVGFSNGGILATGAAARDPRIAAAVIYYGGAPWPTLGPVNHFPPMLILHGDNDQIIPVREGKLLADFVRQFGAPADLVIYPGESHGFGSRLQTANGANALARTVAFLRKQLDVP
jgi:carboxymethylenebutenolidase